MDKSVVFRQIALISNKIPFLKAISLGKNNLESSEIQIFLDELLKIPFINKNEILKTPFPMTIEALGEDSFFHSSGVLEKELLWYSYFFNYFSSEINDINSLRDEFNKNVLLNNLEESRIILDKVEKQYGFSYWLLENKIFLLQEIDGLEKHKEFINWVKKEETKVNPFLKFILSYVSIKMEENVTSEKYNYRISEVLQYDNWETGSDNILEYLKFKLSFKDCFIDKPLPILVYESVLSIYDRYITFLKILSCADLSEISSRSIKQIKLNLSNIKDDFSIRLFSNTSGKIEVLPIFELYTNGEYKKVINRCEELLVEYPFLIDIYPIYVKSVIRVDGYEYPFSEKSILFKIFSYMEDLYLSTNKFNEAYSQIRKITYQFANNLWSIQLRGLIEEIVGSKDLEKNYISQYQKNVKPDNPLFITQKEVNTQAQAEFLEMMDYNPENNTLSLYDAIYSKDVSLLKDISIPKERKESKKALILFNLGEYKRAREIYRKFLKSDDPIYKIEGTIGFISCCIELFDFEQCMHLIVDQFLHEGLLIRQLDFPRMLEGIQNINDSEYDVFSNIEAPILFDIYSKNFNDDMEAEKADSYEEFLLSNGYERPSDIGEDIDLFSKEKLIYFYKHICVDSVMDYSTSFNSTEEIQTERILICQKLREIDPNNALIYSEEIKEITQKQIINSSLREIQQSKIYVDVKGIEKSLEKEIKENFDRYKTLLAAKVVDEEPSYVTLEESIDEFYGVTVDLKMPSDERRQLLYRIIFDIRDSFVSSNKFGLDGYLSVGIRHGTLSGQLRAPLEEKDLLTKKDSETGIYQLSKYWNSQNLEKHVKNKIISAFDVFGKEIDSYIDILKNKWIQIKTENANPEGLFNFQMYLWELEELEKKVNLETSYESLFDMIIDTLWEKTDISLQSIREKIKTELKQNFNESFDRLVISMDSIKDQIDVTDIRNKILTAKTSMQYELDKVSEWFTRNKNTHSSTYNAELLINIVYELTRNIYNNTEVELQKNIENITLSGNTLKSFVDVLFILFDNIVKHSNIEGVIPVTVEFFTRKDKLILKCQNDVGAEVINDENKVKIEEYRRKLGQKNDLTYVSREGGSGFYKIEKIINIDLKCALSMYFGYSDDNKFLVESEIGSGGIVVENINY